ncbi:MAG: EthD family reductase [Actinobacteria bacterium]|nr:EthD family reductase [Actinomycetota bacterium]
MIVRLGMAPRAATLDYEGFQAHWKSEHAGLAGAIEGVRGYVQNHAILRDGRPLFPYAGFDACSEISFDSLEAMDAGFASDYYRSQVVADEKVLVDKTRFLMLLSERRVLDDRPAPEGAVKLLTFLPVDPRSTREALFELLGGAYRERVAASGVALRHEQLLEIPGAHEGRIPAVFAAVDLLWVRTADEAVTLASGDLGHELGYLLAGTTFGGQRVVAEPVTVV